MPYASIVSRALSLGVGGFDTSPYYGPSETLLGQALSSLNPAPARESYFLVTKAGRIASAEFDYSPEWVQYSIGRSLKRLHTSYLDLVYMHDVEFVSPAEVVTAVRELRRLRDEGLIRYVGISGFPVHLLCELAELVQQETGEPLDAVLSYSHYCVQNATLGRSDVLQRFRSAGVKAVLNASMLSMGLLTTRGADAGPMATWHPAPSELRTACHDLAKIAEDAGERLEKVAIYWALDNWARTGAEVGTHKVSLPGRSKSQIGASVMGVSTVSELEETWNVWQGVLSAMRQEQEEGNRESTNAIARRHRINELVEGPMWTSLGRWRDYSWESPGNDYVNQRGEFGVIPESDA
jgi:aryl-alcohol dehydrogenase-like predicted oxidoreductase